MSQVIFYSVIRDAVLIQQRRDLVRLTATKIIIMIYLQCRLHLRVLILQFAIQQQQQKIAHFFIFTLNHQQQKIALEWRIHSYSGNIERCPRGRKGLIIFASCEIRFPI